MSKSSTLLVAAVVAAPIQKLWPLNLLASSPVVLRASLNLMTSCVRDNGEPLALIKRGPGKGLLIAKYRVMAATGQMSEKVLPMYIFMPLRKGFVLLCLI